MATGMVLIIVSRNIDLSVGSLLGFLGYMMALVQTDGDHRVLRARREPRQPRRQAWIWVVALAVGIVLGAAGRRRPGVHRRLRRGPGVHRHPRRLPRLARHDLPHRRQAGPDARRRSTTRSSCSAAAPDGSLGEWRSWLLAVLGCAAIVVEHLRSPGGAAALRPRRPADVGRRRARRRRVRRGDRRRSGSIANKLHLPDHRATRPASPTRS